MAANPKLTGWSPDANWFWDGTRWNDAVSADGKWRFDGRTWIPFAGQRSPMPAATFQPAAAAPAAGSGLLAWVAASEVERLQSEQEEREQAAVAPLPQAQPARIDFWSVHTVIRQVLLWSGVAVGAALLPLGALALSSSSLEPKNAPFVVFTMVLGAALAAACLLQLFLPGLLGGTFAMAGGAVRSLGILGTLVVALMLINTSIALSRPVGGGRYVVPWATLLVIGLRMYRGRWGAAMIIGGVWAASVLLTLSLGR